MIVLAVIRPTPPEARVAVPGEPPLNERVPCDGAAFCDHVSVWLLSVSLTCSSLLMSFAPELALTVSVVVESTKVGAVLGLKYVNWSLELVALVPLAVVTVTWTVPAEPAGDVATISVSLLTMALVALVEPKLTVAPLRKLVPVSVTAVPPAVGPLLGEIESTVGTAESVVNARSPP